MMTVDAPGGDRLQVMHRLASFALVLKAEALMAVQLVVRHRAPRLTATLVLTTVFLAGATGGGGVAPLLLVAGALGAVVASRPLARGPALAAAHAVEAPPWVPAAGRFLGVLATVVPAAAVAASVLTAPRAEPFLAAFAAAAMLAAAVAALVLGLAPFVGATAAASLGLVLVVAGGLAPGDLAAVPFPALPVERVTVFLWEVLPLPWRAVRWQAASWPPDLLCFAAWTGGGVAVAALGVHRGGRP